MDLPELNKLPKTKLLILWIVLLGIVSGISLIKNYLQNKEIINLSEQNIELDKKLGQAPTRAIMAPAASVCEINSPENINDVMYSYSKEDGFCDGKMADTYNWWTRTKTPTGEIGIKWSQDGVINLVLVFDNKTKIIRRALDPYYLVQQNLNFSKMVLDNRYFLIANEKQISPDGNYLVFSVRGCAGCGDGVFTDELYLYNTISNKVKSLGKFDSDQNGVVWVDKQTVKVGEKQIVI